MPELPEVETVRRDLSQHLLGARFTDIKIIAFKNVAPAATFLTKALRGRAIQSIRRRGKLLIFDLDLSNQHLLVHLKMTGQLIFLHQEKSLGGGHSLSDNSFEAAVGGKLPNKFTRAYFRFDHSGQLFFNDIRKFGYIKLVSSGELERIMRSNYGPEPLGKDFNEAWLTSILAKRLAPVKAVILNQQLIAGLGNIYADEALFAAGIDPRRPAKSLRASEVRLLHQVIISLLKRAIKARGTTFRNFVDGRGKKGNFVDYLQVYQRHGQACFNCGQPLLKDKVAGRGTHYCQYCQK